MKIQLSHTFEDIISINNLLEAWKEFKTGKRNRKDVQEFELHLMDQILTFSALLTYHKSGQFPFLAAGQD